MARFGMVIDTRKCVGCMDCVVACETENSVPIGYARDWIATRCAASSRASRWRSAASAATTAQPACVHCCPTGQPRLRPRRHRQGHGQPLHRLQGLLSLPYGARFVNPKATPTSAPSATTASRKARIRPACRSARRTAWSSAISRPGERRGHLLRTRKWHTLLPEPAPGPRLLPHVNGGRHARVHDDPSQPAGGPGPFGVELGDPLYCSSAHRRRPDDPRRHCHAAHGAWRDTQRYFSLHAPLGRSCC